MPGFELIGKEEFAEIKHLFDESKILFRHSFEHLRNNIYKKILSKKKVMYFAVENLSISNKDNCNNVENIWLIKKTLRNCLKKF